MTNKSIKKNYIYNLSYQILVIITPLITTPYLSRVLGADGLGEYSYAESIVSYFVLFATLGLTTFGQREISYVQDSKEKRTIVFWETKIIEIASSLIILCVFIPFAIAQDNSILYFALGFNILAVFVDITWFFQGMEEFGKIVLRNFFFKAVNIAYIFLLVKSKSDLVVYAFGLAFLLFLSNASLWLALPKYLVRINLNELRIKRHLKTVFSLFIPTIAVQVYTVLDKTMIGLITKSAFENGYYEQAFKISKMTLTIVTALGIVMVPRIGFHYNKGEMDIVNRYMYRGYRFVWFIGIPLAFGLVGIASNLVPWFYGDGFDKVVPLLGILGFLVLSIGISNVTGTQYLIPTKRQNLFTLSVVFGAIVNFFLNLVLIKSLLSIGAAIASVAAETAIALVQLYFVRKELSFKKIIYSSGHYLLAGFIMLTYLLLVGKVLDPSILNTLFMIASGGALYFSVLLFIKDDFFLDYSTAVFKKIHKR